MRCPQLSSLWGLEIELTAHWWIVWLLLQMRNSLNFHLCQASRGRSQKSKFTGRNHLAATSVSITALVTSWTSLRSSFAYTSLVFTMKAICVPQSIKFSSATWSSCESFSWHTSLNLQVLMVYGASTTTSTFPSCSVLASFVDPSNTSQMPSMRNPPCESMKITCTSVASTSSSRSKKVSASQSLHLCSMI